MRFLGVLFIMLLLMGCSHRSVIRKSGDKPISLVIINIQHQLNDDAKKASLGYSITEKLKSRLGNEKGISVVQRPTKPTFLEERRRDKKKNGVNYILTTVISNTSTRRVDYPARQRSEGGSSGGWTDFRACVSGNIKLFEPPFTQSSKSFEFKNICISQNQKNYREMLARTAPRVVEAIFYDLLESL